MDQRRRWFVAFVAVWGLITGVVLWRAAVPTEPQRPPTIEERLDRIEQKLRKIDEYLSHP